LSGAPNILMLGLSGSGKTTFLAAFFELVTQENPNDDALSVRDEAFDREYFFDISQKWLGFETLLKSQTGTQQDLFLPLTAPDGTAIDLSIPDVSGETFDHIWDDGEWPVSTEELARGADGILLFARADAFRPPLELPPGRKLDEALPGPSGPKPNEELDDQSVEVEVPEWDSSTSPTQAILADLLQCIEGFERRALLTSVIISAWDTVDDESLTPAQWLEFNMPLLWQMLQGGESERPYAVVGVSAQGGDITDPQVRKRLARHKNPIDRVKVQIGDQVSSDMSVPLRWIFGRES
jgi:GTPase SAR1 family protein